MTRSILVLAISFMIMALGAGGLQAQTLEIAPITIDLAPGRLASTIKVTNRGDRPTTVQVRPYGWTQPDGREQLDPTGDLLTSPPFATIAPGASQTVRIVLRQPAAARENTYRLLVDQLPPAATPGSVQVALRISLPVFAEPAVAVRPTLTWTLKPGTGSDALLLVRNDGLRHARLSDLKLTAASGPITAPGFSFRYVLPGAQVSIPLHAPAPIRGPIHVSAASDQGRVEADALASTGP